MTTATADAVYYQPRHAAKGPASHDAHRLGVARDYAYLRGLVGAAPATHSPRHEAAEVA